MKKAINGFRKNNSFLLITKDIPAITRLVMYADSLNLSGYYIYKYFDKQAVDNDAKANINYTLYRYAEVLLMYAEASNRAEGKPNAQAIKALNDIRSRAKLAAVTTVNVDEFEKAVWAERYFELCFEGKMWFDITRTRKTRNDLTK